MQLYYSTHTPTHTARHVMQTLRVSAHRTACFVSTHFRTSATLSVTFNNSLYFILSSVRLFVYGCVYVCVCGAPIRQRIGKYREYELKYIVGIGSVRGGNYVRQNCTSFEAIFERAREW